MVEFLQARNISKLAIIKESAGSRHGCKLTDQDGRSIVIVRCDESTLIDRDGTAWSLDQVSLPLLLDPDLTDSLEWLRVTADDVARHPEFVPADAFPVLLIWESLLCEAERAMLRPKLSVEQKKFWKQIRLAAKPNA